MNRFQAMAKIMRMKYRIINHRSEKQMCAKIANQNTTSEDSEEAGRGGSVISIRFKYT